MVPAAYDLFRSTVVRIMPRLRPVVALLLIFLVTWSVPGSTPAQDPGDETSAGENSVLRAILVRERTVERDLVRAEKELVAGRLTEGIRSLQSLLDRSADSF